MNGVGSLTALMILIFVLFSTWYTKIDDNLYLESSTLMTRICHIDMKTYTKTCKILTVLSKEDQDDKLESSAP